MVAAAVVVVSVAATAVSAVQVFLTTLWQLRRKLTMTKALSKLMKLMIAVTSKVELDTIITIVGTIMLTIRPMPTITSTNITMQVTRGLEETDDVLTDDASSSNSNSNPCMDRYRPKKKQYPCYIDNYRKCSFSKECQDYENICDGTGYLSYENDKEESDNYGTSWIHSNKRNCKQYQ